MDPSDGNLPTRSKSTRWPHERSIIVFWGIITDLAALCQIDTIPSVLRFAESCVRILATVATLGTFALGCTRERPVPVRDLILHPSTFAASDTAFPVEGILSRKGHRVPGTTIVIRKLVDVHHDTISIAAIPDTIPFGQTVRIRARVYAVEKFGVLRIGPLLVVGGHLSDAIDIASIRWLP